MRQFRPNPFAAQENLHAGNDGVVYNGPVVEADRAAHSWQWFLQAMSGPLLPVLARGATWTRQLAHIRDIRVSSPTLAPATIR